MKSNSIRSIVLIPARMESTRFPNKPLAKINGKPMIQWVYEAVSTSHASDAFVITDSQEIMDAVEAFDGEAILTSPDARNGTERCLEALSILDPQAELYDVIINVQGDEPLVQAEDINRLIALFEEEEIDIATMITPIEKEEEYKDPNVVKAIPTLFDGDYCDINYFSRAPIPFMDPFEPGFAFRHIGIYAFTATAFAEVSNMETSELEELERLEQLRWLQNHLLVSAILTNNKFIGVDTPADLEAVENFLTSLN